ncbi:ABC transporter substrate-binding protein [Actinomyces urogenitalis]|uniref:ABC transporter substrate-binding protein n=1 Tax=Actinomyces urogenitalis TaxID=103621 RepID=UPI00242F9329|nr:ABC transporter substrate-binding protein [Actinomyces urogenitalis]MCI7456391.1 ABC transporter substrate-binding protein [Actinomyces urogenitalis]
MTVSRKTFLVTTAALPLAALLAACGAKTEADSSASAGATGSSEALSVTHAFGTTTVPASPQRVATIAWGNQDVPLALGVMPVGIAKQTWGVSDDSGMLEWTKAKVDELVADGASAPALFDETDAIDFEAVAATSPEVILAAYSGLTQEDYETLSKIAPTIAYPDIAWGTAWRDMIRMDSAGMGRKDEGEALVTELEELISTQLADYPQIAGKSAAFFYATPSDMSSIGFYIPADPRTGFLADLGLSVPESVAKAAKADPDTFYVSVSAENADTLSDVDLMVMYGEDSDLAALQADALLGAIPAIKNGAVAFVGNGTALSASTNPTPLSLPWGLKDYLALIAAAADKVQ